VRREYRGKTKGRKEYFGGAVYLLIDNKVRISSTISATNHNAKNCASKVKYICTVM
jgi:hypothetical protein